MQNRRNICELCGPFDEDDVGTHIKILQHKLNFYLKLREDHRSNFLNYSGILINQAIKLDDFKDVKVSFIENRGIYTTTILSNALTKLGGKLEYNFTITNQDKQQFNIIVEKLYPLQSFFLSNDIKYVSSSLDYTLKPGEHCTFKLTFQLQHVLNSCHDLPIGITIQPVTNIKAEKTLYRDVKITIQNEFNEDVDTGNKSISQFQWDPHLTIFDSNRKSNFINEYPIPLPYMGVFVRGFGKYRLESLFEQEYRLETLKMWETDKVNENNYAAFFHRLLWLEEVTQEVGLKKYNMSKVTVELYERGVSLKVLGLAEKRPSVVKGDYVLLRPVDLAQAYKGIIERVEDETLKIADLKPEFIAMMRTYPNVLLDVKFCLSRLQLDRMHKAVNNCVRNNMLICLFPKRPLNRFTRKSLHKSALCNPLIANNENQLIAVESILSATSQRAPYIIYGPPGTGKTVTLVEAILQVKIHNPSKRILVCAPSNAACDMLASKLNDHLKNRQANDLFRVHSNNRHVNDIPEAIKRFSNLKDNEFTMVDALDLYKYKIVIATLHLIGKYSGKYSPNMVFIDEAAQATEPECDIPISLVTPDVQIVLAGDPKQLGPVCNKLSSRYGLARSLLDRLMESNELYQPLRRKPLMYDNDYITMLIQNYRSHEHIIKIPNELFYENSLKFALTNDHISNTSIAAIVMPRKKKQKGKVNQTGAAIEFIGLLSKDQRNGYSPSYYNDMEIDMVLKIIKSLTGLGITGSEIGVIAPYIRQVVKIRSAVTKLNLVDLQVGTTEAFQGGEKRIMIISTVRAQRDLLLYDRKYDLGFVKNEKRFNVAITRAKSKLIIVGNPYVLGYDPENWGKMITYCQVDLESYFGVEYVPRTIELVDKLHTQFKKIHKKREIANGNAR